MMRIVSLFLMVLFCLSTHSQVVDDIYGDVASTNQSQGDVRAERRTQQQRLKSLNDSVAHNRAALALQRQQWVLQADRVSMPTAYTVHNLNENANFVFQQGDQAMVQVAFNQVDPGLNGLGGVTLDGRAMGPKFRQSDKGELYYSFHISGSNVDAEVFITVYQDSNQAQAIVTPTFGPGQFTLYGKLVPYRKK